MLAVILVAAAGKGRVGAWTSMGAVRSRAEVGPVLLFLLSLVSACSLGREARKEKEGGDTLREEERSRRWRRYGLWWLAFLRIAEHPYVEHTIPR